MSEYHYHFWSACLKKGKGVWSNSQSPALCRDVDQCEDTPQFYTVFQAQSGGQDLAYTEQNWDEVIGIARDGHVIIGPYTPDGDFWGCDRDVCNGRFVDGQYVYVGSPNFPYVVGCWGPGPQPLYKPGCSNSGCGIYAAIDGASALISAGAMTVATFVTFSILL